MSYRLRILLPFFAALLSLSAVTSATTLAIYEFTGQALNATDVDATDGISFSDITIGSGLGDIFDNGAGDFLRFSGDDTENGSGSALSNEAFITFTLTNNSGEPLVLGTIEADYQRTNAFSFSSARLFSEVQGTDSVVDDTIGSFGSGGSGSDDAFVHDIIDLTPSSTEFGANVTAGDFTIADGASLTFTLPWIDGSSSPTRFSDLDNLMITAVPEPASGLMLVICGLLAICGRRK